MEKGKKEVRREFVYMIIGTTLGAALGAMKGRMSLGLLAGAAVGVAIDQLVYYKRQKKEA